MHPRATLATLLALGLLLTAAAGTAAAHKTTYSADGKVKIVWGFLNEPAVTWTKTGLDLILSDNATGAPLEGADKTLDASLVLGDQVHPFEDFAPQHGQKGRYTDVITLTRPGLYSLRLQGTINGSAVDLTIPAQHEVSDVKETYFPEADGPSQTAARLKALEDQVAALKANAQTQAETPATLTPQGPAKNDTPAAGLLGALAVVGLAALVLARRRA